MKLQTTTKTNWIKRLVRLSLCLSVFTTHAQVSREQIGDTIIVLQKTDGGKLDTVKQEKKSTKVIAGEKSFIYNITRNGVKKYYDHYGNRLNSLGEKLPPATMTKEHTNNPQVGTPNLTASGAETIGGKNFFFVKAKSGATTYFDQFGNVVNGKQDKSKSVERTDGTNANGKIGREALLEKSGIKIINGKVHYYAKSKQGLIEYYDQYGNRLIPNGN